MPPTIDRQSSRYLAYCADLRRRLREQAIPEHLQEGLVAYFAERRPTGDFLNACLENDLQDAILRYSGRDLSAVKRIVLFLINDCPAPAWGSPEKVEVWLTDPSVPAMVAE